MWSTCDFFLSFSVLYYCSVSFRRFFERISGDIKTINSELSLNFIRKIKLKQNKQIFVLFVTNSLFFHNCLVFFRIFSIKTCQFIHSRPTWDSNLFFNFGKFSYLQIIKGVIFCASKTYHICLSFFLSFAFLIEIKNSFFIVN